MVKAKLLEVESPAVLISTGEKGSDTHSLVNEIYFSEGIRA